MQLPGWSLCSIAHNDANPLLCSSQLRMQALPAGRASLTPFLPSAKRDSSSGTAHEDDNDPPQRPSLTGTQETTVVCKFQQALSSTRLSKASRMLDGFHGKDGRSRARVVFMPSSCMLDELPLRTSDIDPIMHLIICRSPVVVSKLIGRPDSSLSSLSLSV